MNIVVLVKQVPDTETKIKPGPDAQSIDTAFIKWIMNPYDEFAVEQALLVKQSVPGSVVTALRVGPSCDSEALRTALAMGCDEAIWVKTTSTLDSSMTAKAIVGALAKRECVPDLVFSGKQAIDDDESQIPQRVAHALSIPVVTNVIGFECHDRTLILRREIEGGSVEIYDVQLPALVACHKGLNTPRYPSLPGIMKAKKKEMKEFSLNDVGVSEVDSRLSHRDFRLPPEKAPGKKWDVRDTALASTVVHTVVSLLRNEVKVI